MKAINLLIAAVVIIAIGVFGFVVYSTLTSTDPKAWDCLQFVLDGEAQDSTYYRINRERVCYLQDFDGNWSKVGG